MARELTLRDTTRGGKEVARFDADGMGMFQIGRDPECDLVLATEWISRRHCCLFRENDRIWVEDLKSRDGTLVNGERLTSRVALKDGDEITVGDSVLRVGLPPRYLPVAETVAKPIARRSAPRTTGRRKPAAPGPSPAPAPATWEQTVVASARVMPDFQNNRAIPLVHDSLFVGRDPQCGCPIPSPMVTWHHTRITQESGQWTVEDLQSANGTFLNDMRLVRPHRLMEGNVLGIGPIRFTFENGMLVPRSSGGGLRITARGLTKQVRSKEDGEPLLLLNDVELTIEPREFLVMLGRSGCGKSTFMDALNGRRPATAGTVYFDGMDLYEHFDSLKAAIGYVPQDVIFHDGLMLADSLRHSARLRLPTDTTAAEIDSNIDRVLRIVGLSDRWATRIRDLSGGQKKRVSIAMELLSSPQVMFLDEVTSGLDMGSEQEMMLLFRTMADDGITLVLVTHHLDSLKLADMVAYFATGRLVYCGPPGQLAEHFGVTDLRDIYEAEKETPSEAWEQEFKASKEYRVLVKLRGAREKTLCATEGSPKVQRSRRRGHFLRQWGVLTSRYVKLLQAEYRNVLFIFGLAPAVAAMLCVAARSIPVVDSPVAAQEFQAVGSRQNLLCFGAAIIVLFLALFGSVREIVKEANVYRHERFINLQIGPYYLSKALPLALLGLFQVVVVAGMLQLFGGMHAGDAGLQILVLSLVSILGTALGLAISAAAKSTDWAIVCMIAVVIPEILFSGALVPARGIAGWISKGVIGVYWALRALLGELDGQTRAAMPGNPPAHQVLPGVIVLIAHVAALTTATLLLLVARDEHGPFARLIASFKASPK